MKCFPMFKLSTWNIRGLNELSKQKEVRNLFLSNGCSVCRVIETKVLAKNLAKVGSSVFGSWSWVSNNAACLGRTRIIVGWNQNEVNVNVVHQTNQVIHYLIDHHSCKKKLYCSFVYASNNDSERKCLWRDLCLHNSMVAGHSWLIIGDFNVSLNPEDSSHGSSSVTGPMQDFRTCVEEIEMEDINHSGCQFTWTQKIYAKEGQKGGDDVDRVMGNGEFFGKFPTAHA